VADVAGENVMAGPTGRQGLIRAGDRVVVDDRPQVVLGASGVLIRFADDDGAVEEAPIAELVGSGRLRLPPRGTGGHSGAQIGLTGLPPEVVEQARWWEAHIIEVVDGTRPDAPAGTPPRSAYDVEHTSLRGREQAKAAELSTPDRPVAASTVKHRRQRWQAEGLPGLVDKRVMRRRSPAGRADPAVAEAMEQAIAEVTEESSRTATFIVWRTRQLLAEQGQAAKAPSRATMFRLFSRLSAGRHDRIGGHPRGLWSRPLDVKSAYPTAPGSWWRSTQRGYLVLLDDGCQADWATGMIVWRPDGARGGARPSAPVGGRQRPVGPRAARLIRQVSAEPGGGTLGPAYERHLSIGERLRHAARGGDRAGRHRCRPRVGVRPTTSALCRYWDRHQPATWRPTGQAAHGRCSPRWPRCSASSPSAIWGAAQTGEGAT
jgi:hypothetical protein